MRSYIYAVAGAGAGALVAWAVTADIYEKRLKEKQTHIVNVYNKYDGFNEPSVEVEVIDPNQTELIIPIEDTEDEEPNDEDPEDEEPVFEETVIETRSNLQRLIEQYTEDPDSRSEFVEVATQHEGPSPPYTITKGEYAYGEERAYYAKITLTYFPDDKVILDDMDEPMDNISGDIGWRNLTKFGDESEDPSVVFIRNDRLETDFEVVKDEETPLPLHVKYGMEKEEFGVRRAAGLLKLRPEDE